jgi:L-seryl-tRNA(Ser) seleniumtransferase
MHGSLHERFGLTRVINAAGTFTPVGVSRSSEAVARATAAALGDFFVIEELQAAADRALAKHAGADAGTVTHCAAAGITQAIAATMTGSDPERVAALPDSSGMADRVVIPAGHAVDYGHPILTDIRLAGATPVVAGNERGCSLADIESALAHRGTACLLLVSSRLTRGQPIDLAEAIAAAHRRGVPAIIDGAAQDLRMRELLATGADLAIFSAHKYLASPTAGLIVGRRELVQACRAQERGIARAMKPSKEAIAGVLAALEEREQLDLPRWRASQRVKVAHFIGQANTIPGIRASEAPDPSGMPFSRISLEVSPAGRRWDAVALAAALRDGTPSIRTMDRAATQGRILLELVPLEDDELQAILDRIAAIASELDGT